MQNLAFAFAHGPQTLLAIVTAGVLPDHDRSLEDSSAVIEANAALAQRLGVLGFVPLEFHLSAGTLKAYPAQARNLSVLETNGLENRIKSPPDQFYRVGHVQALVVQLWVPAASL
jgi:hypothetical protein